MGAPESTSPLIQLMRGHVSIDAAPPEAMDLAEAASQWLNAFDAIALQSAHRAIGSVPPTGASGQEKPVAAANLAAEVERTRAVLAKAIAQATLPADPQDGFAGYREQHLALQRRMELAIGPLRAHVRECVGRHGPQLRQLALLDAAMEGVLARREQALLPTLPSLLRRRFEALRTAAPVGDDLLADDATEAFQREWRQALLAELDVRLSPVTGLVEAAAEKEDKT